MNFWVFLSLFFLALFTDLNGSRDEIFSTESTSDSNIISRVRSAQTGTMVNADGVNIIKKKSNSQDYKLIVQNSGADNNMLQVRK